jgi:protein SCO1/2
MGTEVASSRRQLAACPQRRSALDRARRVPRRDIGRCARHLFVGLTDASGTLRFLQPGTAKQGASDRLVYRDPVNVPHSGWSRGAAVAGVLALLTLLVGCASGTAMPSVVMTTAVTPAPMGVRDTVYNPARPAPALRLTDQDGKPFDLTSLHGTLAIVYFGYTHCPDICPTTLADLRADIAAAGLPARVVFVTIDPKRDTAAAMKRYVDFYQAGFIGLTGSDADIAAAAAAWGVGYAAGPVDSNGNYAMSHTTESYLVDASGVLRNHIFFGAPTNLVVGLLRTAAG